MEPPCPHLSVQSGIRATRHPFRQVATLARAVSRRMTAARHRVANDDASANAHTRDGGSAEAGVGARASSATRLHCRCAKRALFRRRQHAGRRAFRASSQGLEREFRCWITGQRLALEEWRSDFVADTGSNGSNKNNMVYMCIYICMYLSISLYIYIYICIIEREI